MGLTACGGAGTSTEAASAPASGTTTQTSTPTPTEVKNYTVEELTSIVGQIQDKHGTKLSVTSSADISGSQDQMKALWAQMQVEPAECKDLAMGSMAQPTTGIVAAVGVSQDLAAGTVSSISLGTGLTPEALEKAEKSVDELATCQNMTLTTPNGTTTLQLTDLGNRKPVGSLYATRMDSKLPDGRTQSMLMSQATKQGVVIAAIAVGGKTEDEALATVTTLMDQAAALIK